MEDGEFAHYTKGQPFVATNKLYKYDLKTLWRNVTEDVVGVSKDKNGKETPWPTTTTRRACYVAVTCEDHDHIYFVTPQSEEMKTNIEINEMREFIVELMKFMARAPDGSIIKCWKDGQWVMELE
jgi:hypothetical protein